MIEEPPLLTIRRPDRRPTEAQIAAFAGMTTAIVSDAMEGAGALDGRIRALDPRTPLVVGPALTVECGPADLLALLAATTLIRPGDVVVTAFGGFRGAAQFGDALAAYMANNGAAGAVTDGPVRDVTGIARVGLPVWCDGVMSATPYANGPGKIGLPVQIGGQRVETGDLVIADRDGVVIVPHAEIDRVAARAAHVLALETELDARLRAGQKVPDGIEALLAGSRVRWVG